MEDALLFQAQAEETCSLWQAGGQAPNVGGGRGHEGRHRRTPLFTFSLMLLGSTPAPDPMYNPPQGGFGGWEWGSGRTRHVGPWVYWFGDQGGMGMRAQVVGLGSGRDGRGGPGIGG